MVAALTNDGTNLYAGLGLTAGDSEVWKWNGTSWSKIGGDGVGSPASWNTGMRLSGHLDILVQNFTLGLVTQLAMLRSGNITEVVG